LIKNCSRTLWFREVSKSLFPEAGDLVRRIGRTHGQTEPPAIMTEPSVDSVERHFRRKATQAPTVDFQPKEERQANERDSDRQR
jgi:hypothetical protein